ncbi:hypothetical protein HPB52_004141 [Rhipicephalus sanguineus]|uniref:Uncharacterized protein n=1 Tax=Rhipicephalus sanguineus TaxID=34632 RepID=A0A9D4T8P2_RHISA|nr:hypothetical protein HPB52_004141 [Rhipicephalus sanguineus]
MKLIHEWYGKKRNFSSLDGPAWREGKRPLERERLWRALRRLAAGVTDRLLLDAAEVLEVALELRELAPLGPRERLRPR